MASTFLRRLVSGVAILVSLGRLAVAGAPSELPYQREWGLQIGTEGHDYSNSGVSADVLGNLFSTATVTGSFAGEHQGGRDVVVAKYELDGSLRWAHQFGTDSNDSGTGVSADNLGNAYVTGSSPASLSGTSSNPGLGGFLTMFDSMGSIQWDRQIAGIPNDISADGLGNVYVVGNTTDSLGGPNAGGNDVFLSKYEDEGNHAWTVQFGTELSESGWGISADLLGNVFVTGTTFGTIGDEALGSADPYAVKFDSAGNMLWAKQWGSSSYEQSFDVQADGSGGAYFAGYETFTTPEGVPIGGAASVRRHDANGDLLWVQYMDSGSSDYAVAIAIDGSGYAYVSGDTRGSLAGPHLGRTDAFLGKFDAMGDLLWTLQFGTEENEVPSSVTVDLQGNVYTQGLTWGPLAGPHLGGGGDVFLLKYSPSEVPEPQTAVLLSLAFILTQLRAIKSSFG